MPEAKTQVYDDVSGHARGGPEAPEVATRVILLIAGGIALFLGLTLTGVLLYYRHAVPGPAQRPPRVFAEPQLQRDPEADLARLQAAQRAQLEGYAWVDRARGIARMPVADAMRMLAARGSDAYRAPVQPERVPSLGSRGGASSGAASPDGAPGAVNPPAGTPVPGGGNR